MSESPVEDPRPVPGQDYCPERVHTCLNSLDLKEKGLTLHRSIKKEDSSITY